MINKYKGYMMIKKGAPLKNKNAQSGDEPAEAYLYMRVRAREKSAWVKSAQADGKKLSQWVRDTLNNKAKK